MRIVMAAAAAAILAGAALSGHALAATTNQSPMQQCAAQWQTLKKTNTTGGQTYKAFTTACMKTASLAPTPAVSAAKPSKRVALAGKTGQPNRMSQCAAQWSQMKAQNKTNGMTYKQWTSQCLKSH